MCQYEALFQPRVAAFGFSVIIVGTGLLGGRPLSRSKNVTQKKQKVRCELSALTPKARDDVTDLVSGMKKGTLDADEEKDCAALALPEGPRLLSKGFGHHAKA